MSMPQWSLRKMLSLALLASLFFTPTSSHAQEQYAPKVGEVHEDFVLPDIATGKPRRLSDFRDTKVLLIHFASW